MDDSDIGEALARTTTFLKDTEGALDACRACVEHDPDGPIGTAGRITAAAAGAFVGLMSRDPGEYPSVDLATYKSKTEIARRLTSIAVPVLANGLVTAAKCRDPAKRANILKFLEAAAEADMRFLRLINNVLADFDILLTPSAPGEAPHGLANTGNSVFNRTWTLLHLPCVNIPAFRGPRGLPVGIQVVGGFWRDAETLACAHWVHSNLCL